MSLPSGEQSRIPEAFTPAMLERVQSIEALPHSRAFEHLLYEQRIERVANHQMADTPIELSPYLMKTTFPEELEDYFLDHRYTIDELEITQTETSEASPHITAHFRANGYQHHIIASGDEAVYEFEHLNGRTNYNMSSSVVCGLIASLVYARQYDSNDSLRAMELTEDSLSEMVSRPSMTALVEQMITTLGHLEGVSSITTTSLFNTHEGHAIMASLKEEETAAESNIASRLELTEIKFIDEQQVTTIDQRATDFGTDEVMSKFAERTTNNPLEQTIFTELIDPEKDYEKWAAVCNELFAAIEADLKRYAELDA